MVRYQCTISTMSSGTKGHLSKKITHIMCSCKNKEGKGSNEKNFWQETCELISLVNDWSIKCSLLLKAEILPK